MKKINNFQNH